MLFDDYRKLPLWQSYLLVFVFSCSGEKGEQLSTVDASSEVLRCPGFPDQPMAGGVNELNFEKMRRRDCDTKIVGRNGSFTVTLPKTSASIPFPGVFFGYEPVRDLCRRHPTSLQCGNLGVTFRIQNLGSNHANICVKYATKKTGDSKDTRGCFRLRSGATFSAGAPFEVTADVLGRGFLKSDNTAVDSTIIPLTMSDKIAAERIDPDAIWRIEFFVLDAATPTQLKIDNLRLARGALLGGMVDRFGQSTLLSWPKKLTDVNSFSRSVLEDRRQTPPTSSRGAQFDQYGGSYTGKCAPASGEVAAMFPCTGHFYTKLARNDRWWLVTPEGNPFFSIGVASVDQDGTESNTTNREYLFNDSVAADEFHGTPGVATSINLYQKNVRDYNSVVRTYAARTDSDAVAFRERFGSFDTWAARTPRREYHWGFNTIGNWSDLEVATGKDLEGRVNSGVVRMPYAGTTVRIKEVVKAGVTTHIEQRIRLFPLPWNGSGVKPNKLPLPGTDFEVPYFEVASEGFTPVPFTDVFDASFKQFVKNRGVTFTDHSGQQQSVDGLFKLVDAATINADPYCIGLFVDNEIKWDGGRDEEEYYVPRAGLNGKGTATRAALLEYLETLYKGSAPAGGTEWIKSWYAAWDLVGPAPTTIAQLDQANFVFNQDASSGRVLINARAKADLKNLLGLIANEYFKTVAQGMREHLPNKLYFGSRFMGGKAPQNVVRRAAAHADVVSFNVYRASADLKEMDWQEVYNDLKANDLAKPMLVGEFMFGARDTGHFLGGVIGVATQKDRGDEYVAYLNQLVSLKFFVGAHWYKFIDEPLIGRRGDEENYNCGLINAADLPHVEMTEKMRGWNQGMYRRF